MLTHRARARHGSLEGVGGLKTNEAYHPKADALLIPKIYFFLNLPSPFFGNVCFIKFGPFSALLALPVMIREEYGQMAHQTLPNILLSDASLVTKSYIARFVDDDAFNPSALSNCSTGPSPPAGARQVDLVAIPGQRQLSTAQPIWPLSLDFRTNGSSQ